MKSLLTTIILLLSIYAKAQDCPKIMKDGDIAFKQKNYNVAIKTYMTVLINCPTMREEAMVRVEKVFAEINQLKDKALKAEKIAKEEKQKAENMVNALMPNEAKADAFGYFWKLGKQSFANYDYTQANLQLLLAKEATNKPANMSDSVETLYKKVKPLTEIYQKATAAFCKNNYTEARQYFAQIKELNPTDSLSLFMYYACGDYRTENMVKVEGGKFHPFADDYSDVNPYKGEVMKNVEWTLDAYHIGLYEVTNAQYTRFLNEKFTEFKKSGRADFADSVDLYIDLTGYHLAEMKSGITLENDIYKVVFGYENRPVAWVSWHGAEAFCRFYDIQLPTEAQWEFAARGGLRSQTSLRGLTSEYVFAGSDTLDLVGWYAENSGKRTHTCGTKHPNQLGIYDMSGNVWEWCFDWHVQRSKYISKKNPEGVVYGTYRVIRGGSWCHPSSNISVDTRSSWKPFYRGYDMGFRLVRVP